LKIQQQATTVTSNLPQGRSRTNGVSLKGMAHIIGLLTNLYNDRELAVIREYYTNALDAHKHVGNPNPVRVTLPTWDKPNYIVQDFGVGMTEDTLFDVYGEYGESTGQDNNDIVGGFGLGSKSAYTIAKAFTVVSVKDGMRTTAHYSKKAHGVYDSQIIDSRPTTQPNGTTVNIPVGVEDLAVFNSKAHKFFAYSVPGSVLVDGKEPSNALEHAERLENPKDPAMMVYLKPKESGDSFVIMGNVPYFLSNNEIRLSLERLKVQAADNFIRMPKFFTVPIGSVDISPNREGLQMTDMTNDEVDKHISFIVNDLQEIAKKEMDKAEDLEEFYGSYARWNSMVTVPKAYKGETVPNEIKTSSEARIISKSNWGNASHTETNWVQVKVGSKRLIVTGYNSDTYKKVNNYLTPFMAAEGIGSMTFIVSDADDLVNNKWVKFSSHFDVISGDKLIEIGRAQRKLERQAASKLNGTANKTKIRYPILFVDEAEIRWVDHDEIDSKTPYLQVSDMNIGADMSDYIKSVYKAFNYDRSVSDKMTEYFELVTDAKEIILLSNTRTVKALLQRVKETTPLIEEIKVAANNASMVITPELVKHHAVKESSWHRFLLNAGIDKMIKDVKDPEIIEIITPTAKTLEDYKKFETTTGALECFRYAGMPYVKHIDTSSDATVKHLNIKYPLVESLNAWTLKQRGVVHIVKYLNMVHNESKLPLGA